MMMYCPICKSSHHAKLGELRFQLFDNKSGYERFYEPSVVYCYKCGLVRYDSFIDNYDDKDERINGIITYDNNDRIILSHTEHIQDLVNVMNNINQKFDNNNNNSILCVNVPNALSYSIYENPLRFFYPTHVNHFDIHSLRNLFVTYGFQPIKHGYKIWTCDNYDSLSIPYIWCIFKKTNADIEQNCVEHVEGSFNLSNKIKKWFVNNKKKNCHNNCQLDTNDILENLAMSRKSVYIWGLGFHVQMMLGMSKLRDCNIKQLIDNNIKLQNKTLTIKDKIYDIKSINILRNADNARKDTETVIILGAPTHIKHMKNELKNIGYKGQVIEIGFMDIRYIRWN